VEQERLKHLQDWGDPTPVGSGPFEFELWHPGEKVHLSWFENHSNTAKARGFILVKSARRDVFFLALKKGDIDMHERRLLPHQVEGAKTVPHLALIDRPDLGVFYMGFNLREPPFDDVRFRRALARTVNYDVNVNWATLGTPGMVALPRSLRART